MKICPICSKEFEPKKNGATVKYCSSECIKETRKTRNRERWREANPGWNEGLDKKCVVCGENYIANPRHKESSKYCSLKCRQRRSAAYGSIDDYLSALEVQSIKAKEDRKIELESRLVERQCVECNKLFKTIQPNQVTCSTKCSKKRKNRRNDKRLNINNIVDKDITLATLYKRDKGICYICGKQCDFEDYIKDDYNQVTVGKTHPTIDHIIPLARGGMHSWNNIRLAHHLCNSIKSDTIPDKAKELIPSDAYVLARKISTQNKQVSQWTKEGKLVASYKSTIDAERQTSIKNKGIQNCARGECKTYGGYTWKYTQV